MTIAYEGTDDTAKRSRSLVPRDRTIVTFVSIIVFLPSALFAAALRPLPALVVLVGCLASLALIATQPSPPRDGLQSAGNLPRLAACFAFAGVILLLGGETHLFFATSDWLIRDAVLSDLSRHGFTVVYRVGDADYLLRAPLGMYLVPALLGQSFGLRAAQLALLGQNALFLGVIFYLLTSIGRGWVHLLIMVLFAGLSIVGTLLLSSHAAPAAGIVPRWLRLGLDSWHPMFQFSGSMVQFFWVPNHALPGWWLATLFLLERRSSSVDVATLLVTAAGLAFWSPLAILPAVPLLVYVTATRWRSVLVEKRTWLGLAAGLCFVPILIYLVLASSSIAHKGTLQTPDFVFWYTLFLVLQLPALLFIGTFWREIPREWRVLVVINGLVLVALPFFSFGPNNDLVMRGSITPLAIVAFVFGWVVLDLTRRRGIGAVFGWILVVAASPSAMVEIGRALATPRFAGSECSLMEASRDLGDKNVPTNYVAPIEAVPPALLSVDSRARVPSTRRGCWPDRVPPRYLSVR